MEEHGGELELNDRDGGGAIVRMVFSRAALAEILERSNVTHAADSTMVAE